MSTADAREVYPIGYLAGQFGTAPDDQVHAIRRGWDIVTLDNALDFELWATAHGSLTHDWSTSWTLERVAENLRASISDRNAWTAGIIPSAQEVSGQAVEDAFARLTDRGLIALVGSSSDERVRFAQAHRFDPLLIGLGNTAARPDLAIIGLRDQPVMQVPESQIDFWQMANQFDSVWTACECITDAVREGPFTGADPLAVLAGVSEN